MRAILVDPIPLDKVLEEQGTGESGGLRESVCGNDLQQGEREGRLRLFGFEGRLGCEEEGISIMSRLRYSAYMYVVIT